MKKFTTVAATLAMVLASAVPAYAQVESNDSEFNLDAEDNNIAVQNSGDNTIVQSNENNQNAQYNTGSVEQNNEQANNALLETGDNEAEIGDGDGFEDYEDDDYEDDGFDNESGFFDIFGFSFFN